MTGPFFPLFQDQARDLLTFSESWFLYGMNNDGTISGFAINGKTGALTEVSGSPFQNPLQQRMTIDPVYNLLFTSNSDASCSKNALTSFRINSTTGQLTRIATSAAQRPALSLLHRHRPVRKFRLRRRPQDGTFLRL